VHGVVTARNYYVLSLMRCLCNSGIVSVKPMIDRRPALIARCASPGGVVQAVEFARKHNLLVSIRGGGHNIAGNAVCDDGLMIDLSLMKGVQVDPNARRATVEPGCTLADFDAAAQMHGLATPLGINSTTGVAGLTLGGGFGWLSRKYGMWESAAEDERSIAWAREFFAKSRPFASSGAYINFLTQDETDRIAFAYGATYNRLVELKKKYDPTNLFRMNQNIKPA
jgi:FAD/FMN-containing dehydrogenase